MTKLLKGVDSAATKGARMEARQWHASLFRTDGSVRALSGKTAGSFEIKKTYGSGKQKVIIRRKAGD